jgi:hypothetical protein
MRPLCDKYPELNDYGFFRRIGIDELQFLPFCHENAGKMISFKDDDTEIILNALLGCENR